MLIQLITATVMLIALINFNKIAKLPSSGEQKSRCFMNTLSKRMSTIMFRSLLAFLPSFNMKLLGKKSKWWKDPLIFSLDKEHLIFYDTETWKTLLFSDLLFWKLELLRAIYLTFKLSHTLGEIWDKDNLSKVIRPKTILETF